MTIHIDKTVVGALVSRVIGVTERRTVLPILSNVLFRLGEGQIQVIGSDMEVSVVATTPYELPRQDLSFLLPARRFYELLKEMDESDIEIEVGSTIKIRQEAAEFEFSLQDASDFPLTHVEAEREMILRAREFLETIEKVSFAASTDESKYVLTGIYIEAKDGILTTCATDGYRLALYSREVTGLEPFGGVVVPKRALLELEKLLKDGSELELGLGRGYMMFAFAGSRLITRLIDETFPNYRAVLPVPTAKAECSKTALGKAVRRASIMIGKSDPIRVELSGGKIRVSSESELGRAAETIGADYSGVERVLHFNVRFLLDALSHLEGEYVKIGLSSEYGPVTFEGEEANYKNIVMPVRV